MTAQSTVLSAVPPDQAEPLLPILHDAWPDDELCRAYVANPAYTAYAACQESDLVGAAVVQWADESELWMLAVVADRRGQGIGQAIVAALLEEARRRSVRLVRVGTDSLSPENLMFYQKCGFRMSHIRRGFFDTLHPPIVSRGITLRDMVVFDYTLSPSHLTNIPGDTPTQ